MRLGFSGLLIIIIVTLLIFPALSVEQNATATILNEPPSISLQSPEDGATGLGLEVELKAFVTDLNNDTMNVTFYDSNSGSAICTKTAIESGSNLACTWENLKYSRTYRWYVEATDGINTTRSETRYFRTRSSTWGQKSTPTPPPNEPPKIVILKPENNSLIEFTDPHTGEIELKVFLLDPDGDKIDVQFLDEWNKVIHEEKEIESGSDITVNWSGLLENKTYKWRVEATNGKENTSSGWYQFTTTPYEVINVPPKFSIHSITGKFDLEGVNIVLSATVTDEDGDMMEVGFYDDRLNPLCVYRDVENGTVVACEVTGLQENTRYQWYLMVSDGKEKVLEGPYIFTTEHRIDLTQPRKMLELFFYILVVSSACLAYLWFRMKTK